MSGEQIRELRTRLNMDREAFAELLGISLIRLTMNPAA